MVHSEVRPDAYERGEVLLDLNMCNGNITVCEVKDSSVSADRVLLVEGWYDEGAETWVEVAYLVMRDGFALNPATPVMPDFAKLS